MMDCQVTEPLDGFHFRIIIFKLRFEAAVSENERKKHDSPQIAWQWPLLVPFNLFYFSIELKFLDNEFFLFCFFL